MQFKCKREQSSLFEVGSHNVMLIKKKSLLNKLYSSSHAFKYLARGQFVPFSFKIKKKVRFKFSSFVLSVCGFFLFFVFVHTIWATPSMSLLNGTE